MTEVINIDALASASVHDKPWHWAYCENTLVGCETLAGVFPVSGLEHHAQRGIIEENGRTFTSEWRTRDAARDLIRLGERKVHEPYGLDERWMALAWDLLSPDYRDVMSDLARVDLRVLGVRAYFHFFDEGYSCKPHIDQECERVAHLIYLDAGARDDRAAYYKIYNSGDGSDVHSMLPPKANQSIIQVRSDNAWHDAGKGARKMIHITFESVR